MCFFYIMRRAARGIFRLSPDAARAGEWAAKSCLLLDEIMLTIEKKYNRMNTSLIKCE